MSELEKRQQEIIQEANQYAHKKGYSKLTDVALNHFFVKKIAELELKIEALEAPKISGDTRIGGQIPNVPQQDRTVIDKGE